LFEADINGANFEVGWGFVVIAVCEICLSAVDVTTDTFLPLNCLLFF
jgi:hypothetical protein